MSYEYTPSDIVVDVHGFGPRRNFNGEDAPSDFDLEDENYAYGVLYLGMICCAVGLGQVLLYVLWVCCRCLCGCCKIQKTTNRAALATLTTLRRSLFAMLFVTMIVGLAGLDGNTQMSSGVDSISVALQLISDDSVTLADAAGDLSSISSSMVTTMHSIEDSCAEEADVSSYFEDFYATLDEITVYAGDFSDQVGEFPGAVDDAQSGLNDFDDYREAAVAAPIVAIMLMAVLGILGACVNSPCALRVVSLLGMGLLVVVTVGVTFEFTMSIALSDACMDPDSVLLTALDGSSEAVEALDYYLTCDSTASNPVQDTLSDLSEQLSDLEREIDDYADDLDEYCDGFGEVDDMLGDASSVIGSLSDLMDCSLIADPWREGMHDGVCSEMTPGLVILWATTAACGQLLMFSLVLAAHTWTRLGKATAEEINEQLVPVKIVQLPSTLGFSTPTSTPGELDAHNRL